MLVRGLNIAGVNVGQYVKKNTMAVAYNEIKGLEDVITEDLVAHYDILGYRRTFTFDLNFVNEVTALVLIGILKNTTVTVKLTDPAVGSEETILCRASAPSVSMKLTKPDGSSYWEFKGITLTEVSGHSV